MAQLNNTVELSMFYGANSITHERARSLRSNPTPAEEKLWSVLRNNQIQGLRFKRQHPISFFIADFYCHPIKLVIEVDGGIHENINAKEYDENRAAEMKRLEITTIRFPNDMIIYELEKVEEEIVEHCRRLVKMI